MILKKSSNLYKAIFGMIVTEDQGKPLATHLPLIFQKMVMIIILVDILPKEIRNGRL